jgi:hypothetical protein
MGVRGGEGGDYRLQPLVWAEDLAHGPNHTALNMAGVARFDRKETVLGIESRRRVLGVERHAGHAPARVTQSDQVVENHSLVRTMKGARAKMNDPRAEGASVIGGARYIPG